MAKIKSFGVRVIIDGVFVGGLTDANVGGVDVTFIDITTHDSSGGYKEFIGGLLDGGTLDLTGKFDIADAGQLALMAGAGDEEPVYVLKSDNSGFSFSGIIGGYSTTNPLDDAVEFSSSVKITGAMTSVAAFASTMTITGTIDGRDGESVVVPIAAVFTNMINGKPRYNAANTIISWTVTGTPRWLMVLVGSADPAFESTAAVATPDLVSGDAWHTDTNPHGWRPMGSATGTPIVTPS